ncbi:MAG: hypothetical protein R3183_08340 [Oleiphilaceae bacterium]|nr:hypothetical protein [Oleiphilaceae bacterium]
MYPDPSEPVVPGNKQPSPFTCIICKKGEMLPAVQEGEPDYTDNFVCQHCHHRDTIPTVSNICNQFFTSLLGGAVGLYLLIFQLRGLLLGIQNQSEADQAVPVLLILVAMLFISGFVYVLYQAFRGMQLRKAYIDAGKTKAVKTRSNA